MPNNTNKLWEKQVIDAHIYVDEMVKQAYSRGQEEMREETAFLVETSKLEWADRSGPVEKLEPFFRYIVDKIASSIRAIKIKE